MAGKDDFRTRTLFTTGHVSRLCGVAPRTVGKWMDEGLILGYRIPGSKDRRFLRKNVEAFLAKNGMPTIEEFIERMESANAPG